MCMKKEKKSCGYLDFYFLLTRSLYEEKWSFSRVQLYFEWVDDEYYHDTWYAYVHTVGHGQSPKPLFSMFIYILELYESFRLNQPRTQHCFRFASWPNIWLIYIQGEWRDGITKGRKEGW